MAVYAARTDIEQIYGTDNVRKWADVNNNGNLVEVAARIEWAASLASAEIDSKLGSGQNRPPFAATPAYDTMLIDTAARLAGVRLYEARGVVDDEGEHNLTIHEDRVNEFLRLARAGLIAITGATGSINYPMGVPGYADVDDLCHDNCKCKTIVST